MQTILSLPMLIVSVVVWRAVRKVESTKKRISVTAVPLALSIAPVYVHTSMFPLYIVLLQNGVSPIYAVMSFSVTWTIIVGVWLVFFR